MSRRHAEPAALPHACEARPLRSSRGGAARPEDPLQGEDPLDRDHALHFPRVLPDSPVRLQDEQVIGPVLLDARPARLQPRHADGTRHFSHHHRGPRHAAPRRLEDHRCRPGSEGGPRAVQRRAEAVRHPDDRRRGRRVRHLRHVRRRARAWRGELDPHHPAAVRRGHDRDHVGRAAAEGLRARLRHLAVHCNEHLRDDCVEVVLAHHDQHGPRHRV